MKAIKVIAIFGGFFNAGVIGYLLTKDTPITIIQMVWFGIATISVVIEFIDAIVNEKTIGRI